MIDYLLRIGYIISDTRLDLSDKQYNIDKVSSRFGYTPDNTYSVNTSLVKEIDNKIYDLSVSKMIKNISIKNHISEALTNSKVSIGHILVKILLTKVGGGVVSGTNIRMILKSDYIDTYLTSIFVSYELSNDYKNVGYFKEEYNKKSDSEVDDICFWLFDLLIDCGVIIFDHDTHCKNLPYYRLSSVVDIKKKIMILPRVIPLSPYKNDGGWTSYSSDGVMRYSLLKRGISVKESSLKLHSNRVDASNYLMTIPFGINRKAYDHCRNNRDDMVKKYSDIAHISLSFSDEDAYAAHLCTKGLDRAQMVKMINIFRQSVNICNEFDNALDVCGLFLNSGCPMFFTTCLDWRSRTYYNESPVNPQGSRVIRDLIRFYGSSDDDFVDLDALASGFQMVGLITGDVNILRLTNIIGSEKSDIYDELTIEIHKSFKLIEIDLTYDQLVETFDRKEIKYIAMQKLYSEGNHSRIKCIQSVLFKKLMKIVENDSCVVINECIVRVIDSMFPVLVIIEKTICDIGISVARKNTNLMIGVNEDYVDNRYPYLKQEKKSLSYRDITGKKRKMEIMINKLPIQYNLRKLKNSVTVNFIHMLDGYVLAKLILKCKLYNFPIFVVHDSVRCKVAHVDNIKMLYFVCCQEMVKDRCIRYFLSLNGVDIEDHSVLLEYEKRSLSVFGNEIEYINRNENILKVEVNSYSDAGYGTVEYNSEYDNENDIDDVD